MTSFCKGGKHFTDQVVLPGGIILTHVYFFGPIFYHSFASRGRIIKTTICNAITMQIIHKVPFDNHLNFINQIKQECLCNLKVWKNQREASVEFALFEKTSDLEKSYKSNLKNKCRTKFEISKGKKTRTKHLR